MYEKIGNLTKEQVGYVLCDLQTYRKVLINGKEDFTLDDLTEKSEILLPGNAINRDENGNDGAGSLGSLFGCGDSPYGNLNWTVHKEVGREFKDKYGYYHNDVEGRTTESLEREVKYLEKKLNQTRALLVTRSK